MSRSKVFEQGIEGTRHVEGISAGEEFLARGWGSACVDNKFC